ncbi:WD40 repeat protein [Cryptosporidium ryanae]|uniref:WD40 repeat protein n=1 Tax=Cryptosporidium ryanae TaxID=515981 RepID=UPI00351A9ADC|nr:WD40 repeat protein [Cryptosporidium ryanae]
MKQISQSSPFSSMLNFTFFGETKKVNKTEDYIKQEKHNIWKENTSLLYENVMTHILEWPSLSVQWMDKTNSILRGTDDFNEENNETYNYSLLIGTHTSGVEQDYIIIMDTVLPKFPIPETCRTFESHTDYAGFKTSQRSNSCKFRQNILIPHDGEPNKVIHSPSNVDIIASKTTTGNVNLYDLKSMLEGKVNKFPVVTDRKPTLVLSGHDLEGWALNWNEINESYLASGSDDMMICVWDFNSGEYNGNSSIEPLVKFKGHKKSVQDLAWHPSNENLLISVGDDGLIMMWDIRESRTPCYFTNNSTDNLNNNNQNNSSSKKKIIGYSCFKHSNSTNSLNSVEFNPFQTNLIAVGGSNPAVLLYDIRNMNSCLHSFNGHTGQINRIKFLLEDVSLLASASSDCTVSIWDMTKIGMEQRPDEAEDGVPELIFTHSGHTSPVNDISCFMGDFPTTTFASISENNSLHIWNPGETIFISDDEDEGLERVKNINVE